MIAWSFCDFCFGYNTTGHFPLFPPKFVLGVKLIYLTTIPTIL